MFYKTKSGCELLRIIKEKISILALVIGGSMQDTGIIRRIDELGRVVIPKELRKKLKIREGDPLEIYTNKNEMVLKKYSPVASISDHAKAVVNGISAITEKICIVTDNNVVIACSTNRFKDWEGKEITEGIDKSLKERKSVIVNRSDGGTIIPVVKNAETEMENQIIVPITANGDCYGSVILLDSDKNSRFSLDDVKLVRLGSGFLSNQFED